MGFRLRTVPSRRDPTSGVVRVVSPTASEEVVRDTWMEYTVENGTRFSYNVHIAPALRGLGLNRLMVLHLLRENSSIEEMPVSLQGVNLGALLVEMLEVEGDKRTLAQSYDSNLTIRQQWDQRFVRQVLSLRHKSAEDIAEFRRRFLVACMQSTPAGRIAEEVGFSHLRSARISVNATTVNVDLEIHRGRARVEDAEFSLLVASEDASYSND